MNKVEEVKEMLTDTVAKIYSTIKDSSLEGASCTFCSSNSPYY